MNAGAGAGSDSTGLRGRKTGRQCRVRSRKNDISGARSARLHEKSAWRELNRMAVNGTGRLR